MTYLESMIDKGTPEWLFQYPGHLGVDLSFVIQVIWEHVDERGSFDATDRDLLVQRLRKDFN